MRFSLFFFSAEDSGAGPGRYNFLLDAARFADGHEFEAVWTPERHFHSFGGLYPDPAVLSGALALATRRLGLRSGSVVLPIHDTMRVAESWAVVDNLSGGRVSLSLAPGFHPNDFALRPEAYGARREIFWRELDVLRRLWRGEAVARPNGNGESVAVRIYPQPIQRELPIWITAADSEDTFARAGAQGLNVLTALVTQSLELLPRKLEVYRRARAEHGFDPSDGCVTLMLHTLVGTDLDEVRNVARSPLRNYLRTNLDFLKPLAATGSSRAPSASSLGGSGATEASVLEFALERYLQRGALIGTVDSCWPLVQRLGAMGVDEIGCLIDFGVEPARVLDSLPHLDELSRRAQAVTRRDARLAVRVTAGS